MPRPQKQTVEYFSHDADASNGRTLSVLFNHFGHEGLSAWWLLLERLARTRNHVIAINNGEDTEVLAATMHFQPERLKEILSKMAELQAIDPLLLKNGQIWCQHFVDRLDPVYQKRGQAVPRKPPLPTPEMPLPTPEMPLPTPEIQQSKESKVKRVKRVKNTKETKNKEINRDLPDWMDKETWKAYLEMRIKKKKPATAWAEKLLIKKLNDLRASGQDAKEILNQSIVNNWTDVYAIKQEDKSHGRARAHQEESTGITGRRKAPTSEEYRAGLQ